MSEVELLIKQQEQLYGIQKILKTHQLSLDDITELIPGVVHLNKIHSLDLTYLDKRSREILEVTKDDVIYNGKQLLSQVVKPESFQQAKKLFGKLDFEDSSRVVSHFQALRYLSENNTYEWFYSVKKKFDDTQIITISNPVSTLDEMQKEIEKLLEENQFIKKNLHKLNALTSREKEIIKLILKGHSSNKIAEMLFISPHTVSTHRKNIKHKLKIKNYNELYKFASEFDLL